MHVKNSFSEFYLCNSTMIKINKSEFIRLNTLEVLTVGAPDYLYKMNSNRPEEKKTHWAGKDRHGYIAWIPDPYMHFLNLWPKKQPDLTRRSNKLLGNQRHSGHKRVRVLGNDHC